MPTLSLNNVRLVLPPSSLQIISASRLCLGCRLSSLAKKRSTISSSHLLHKHKSNKIEQRRYKATISGPRIGSEGQTESFGGKEEDYTRNINQEGQLTATNHGSTSTPISRAGKRSNLPKRALLFIDGLVAKATIAGQRVNTLTGTDYSGIEALRRKIKEQEQSVVIQHAAVYKAREAVDAAHTQQAASQKEVVGLLERKSSWSAADLERYMALIRSEHSNDLAVQAAKESLNEAERALEEARSQLEKRERAQYHEEQIWSDTIRRNSTWVTIGLMGVNMLILLSSVIVIEPWRRKNMVKEIKTVLDDQLTQQRLGIANGGASTNSHGTELVVENKNEGFISDLDIEESVRSASYNPIADEVVGQSESPGQATPSSAPDLLSNRDGSRTNTSRSFVESSLGVDTAFTKALSRCEDYIHDAFSDRNVTIQQNELTKATLQGASVGALLVAVVFSVIRSR